MGRGSNTLNPVGKYLLSSSSTATDDCLDMILFMVASVDDTLLKCMALYV